VAVHIRVGGFLGGGDDTARRAVRLGRRAAAEHSEEPVTLDELCAGSEL
jgi:hypothetical protein